MLWHEAMIDRPEPWSLEKLDAYVEAVLRRMADNRDVMSDARGEPYYVTLAAGVERNGKLRLDLVADLSGIGMPMNTPITVKVDPESGPVSWLIEETLIGATERTMRPDEAGCRLGMDALLNAHRSWVGKQGGRGR